MFGEAILKLHPGKSHCAGLLTSTRNENGETKVASELHSYSGSTRGAVLWSKRYQRMIRKRKFVSSSPCFSRGDFTPSRFQTYQN